MSDLVERLRETLSGVAQEESGGDNLAILLASYFEPGIESDELDDSGTWKQGAIDACDKVLDAIHGHYATALTAKDKEIAEWKELAERSTRRLAELAEPGSIGAFAARDYWKARAETAERERDEAQFGFEHELRIKKELAGALRKAERERDRIADELDTMNNNHRVMAKLLADTGRERDMLGEVIEDTARELGCENDNEAILIAIDKLRRERDEARAAVKPFTAYTVKAITVSEEYDYCVHVACAVDDQPMFKHFKAARAVTEQGE